MIAVSSFGISSNQQKHMSHESAFKSLDEFIAYAEKYAGFALHQEGRLGAAFIFLGADGSVFFLPVNTADARAKHESTKLARLVCCAHSAAAVVFIAEAWMSNQAGTFTHPSKALDRKEIVVLTAEGYGMRKQKFLPIVRTESGKFFGFGESSGSDSAEGRFTNILPTGALTPEVQALANNILLALGVTVQTGRDAMRDLTTD
jgi:hypothetical protein